MRFWRKGNEKERRECEQTREGESFFLSLCALSLSLVKERERERGGFLSLKTKRASNEQFDVVSRSLFFLLHHLFSSIALSLSLCI